MSFGLKRCQIKVILFRLNVSKNILRCWMIKFYKHNDKFKAVCIKVLKEYQDEYPCANPLWVYEFQIDIHNYYCGNLECTKDDRSCSHSLTKEEFDEHFRIMKYE
jgi:hypothetical protein